FRLAYTGNGRPRELEVRYDAKTQTLQGSVKRKNKVTERSVPATDIYDPSTALYLFRSTDLTAGKPFQVEVFTGKERYRITVQMVRKEDVQLTSGTRPALRLHPMVFSLDDAPQKNLLPDETTLWVATDATHTPLKLESFVPIGQVVVELSSGSSLSGAMCPRPPPSLCARTAHATDCGHYPLIGVSSRARRARMYPSIPPHARTVTYRSDRSRMG